MHCNISYFKMSLNYKVPEHIWGVRHIVLYNSASFFHSPLRSLRKSCHYHVNFSRKEFTCKRVSAGVVEFSNCTPIVHIMNKQAHRLAYCIVMYVTQNVFVMSQIAQLLHKELEVCQGWSVGNVIMHWTLHCITIFSCPTGAQRNIILQWASAAFIHNIIISKFLTCSSFNEHTCFSAGITVGTLVDVSS